MRARQLARAAGSAPRRDGAARPRNGRSGRSRRARAAAAALSAAATSASKPWMKVPTATRITSSRPACEHRARERRQLLGPLHDEQVGERVEEPPGEARPQLARGLDVDQPARRRAGPGCRPARRRRRRSRRRAAAARAARSQSDWSRFSAACAGPSGAGGRRGRSCAAAAVGGRPPAKVTSKRSTKLRPSVARSSSARWPPGE